MRKAMKFSTERCLDVILPGKGLLKAGRVVEPTVKQNDTEKLSDSWIPLSTGKIILIFPVADFDNQIKTSKFLRSVMENNSRNQILKAIFARLALTLNVLTLFVISPDIQNNKPNGLKSLLETEETSFITQENFIPMLDSLFQQLIPPTVVIMEEEQQIDLRSADTSVTERVRATVPFLLLMELYNPSPY